MHRRSGLSLLLLFAACGGGSTSAPRLSVAVQGLEAADGGAGPVLQMQSGETRTLLLLAVGSEGAAVFSAENLPAFANLTGPLLTLAPGRANAGTYDFSITATAKNAAATLALSIEVHRQNQPPQFIALQGDFPPFTFYLLRDTTAPATFSGFDHCPGSTCTLLGTPVVGVVACDPDGNPITVEVELVPVGQPFTRVATARQTFPGPACAPYSGPPTLLTSLPGTSAGVSYAISVRLVDSEGAVATGYPLLRADGWVDFNAGAGAFDQGPCGDRQCACVSNLPPGPPQPHHTCLRDSDCCSGHCFVTGPVSWNSAGVCEAP